MQCGGRSLEHGKMNIRPTGAPTICRALCVGGTLKDSYVVIQSFMVDQMKLKGNELIVFAVIYGYTQDGEHWYYGTRGHLAEWCGASKGTVSNCLKSLMDKGYIAKREVQRHGHVENQYQAVVDGFQTLSKIDRGSIKNCNGGVSKISTYNIKENNKNIRSEDKVEREYPASVPCDCGGIMLKTSTFKSKTDEPYYRCGDCGKEGLL